MKLLNNPPPHPDSARGVIVMNQRPPGGRWSAFTWRLYWTMFIRSPAEASQAMALLIVGSSLLFVTPASLAVLLIGTLALIGTLRHWCRWMPGIWSAAGLAWFFIFAYVISRGFSDFFIASAALCIALFNGAIVCFFRASTIKQ